MNLKFEDAYFSLKNRTITIDEITELFNINPSEFSGKYKDYLFCPECKTAKLSYHNANPPRLQTYPLYEHADGCPLTQDEMSPYETSMFIKGADSSQISKHMKSIMALLNDKKNYHTDVKTKTTLQSSHTVENKSHKNIRKRPPRKRIDIALRDEDFGCYKFFYGNVVLYWKKRDFGGHLLTLKHPKTYELLCFINITDKVYQYLTDIQTASNRKIGQIVFLAKLKRNAKDIISTTLERSNFIYII